MLMIFPACQEPNKHVLSSEIEPIGLGQTPMYDCTPIYDKLSSTTKAGKG